MKPTDAVEIELFGGKLEAWAKIEKGQKSLLDTKEHSEMLSRNEAKNGPENNEKHIDDKISEIEDEDESIDDESIDEHESIDDESIESEYDDDWDDDEEFVGTMVEVKRGPKKNS